MPSWLSLISIIAISEFFATLASAFRTSNRSVLIFAFIFRWRDFGLLWIFVIFNAVAAVAIYYVARVVRLFVPYMRLFKFNCQHLSSIT